MDIARLLVAGLPLALYLLLLAAVNLSRRPYSTTGTRNSLALALALLGFIAVGPMDLLMPEEAVRRYRIFVWPIAICFYSLCVTLWLMLARPRLIVYNISLTDARTLLHEVVGRLDPEPRWAGDSVYLPQLGVQFHLESFAPLRNVSLVGFGVRNSFFGWRQLRAELQTALRTVEVAPNPYGFLMLAVGMVLLAYPLTLMCINGNLVAEQFFAFLRLS